MVYVVSKSEFWLNTNTRKYIQNIYYYMLFIPKKTKYVKNQKKTGYKKTPSTSNELIFGNFGIKCLDFWKITPAQLEASRRAITRKTKKLGKIWIRCFSHISVTKKPNEVRMGKGKGNVFSWKCAVNPGMILFELSNVSEKVAFSALQSCITKLPVRCKIIMQK